jgi:hypothetical protein
VAEDQDRSLASRPPNPLGNISKAAWLSCHRLHKEDRAMTFEDYIISQIMNCAKLSIRMGMAQDGKSASIMTWTDNGEPPQFWDIS